MKTKTTTTQIAFPFKSLSWNLKTFRDLSLQDLHASQDAWVREKKLNPDAAQILCCSEVRPVLTLGRNSHEEHLLLSPEELSARGIDVCAVNRGGDVTYHGPGQWLIYPIVHLKEPFRDLRAFVWSLEEAASEILKGWGLSAERRSGAPGLWVKGSKIVSIGLGCSGWVTYHGLGFNVNTDLSYFDTIVPCGLAGVTMTSLSQQIGERVPDELFLQRCYEVFGVKNSGL